MLKLWSVGLATLGGLARQLHAAGVL
jgi:hypothetical protein